MPKKAIDRQWQRFSVPLISSGILLVIMITQSLYYDLFNYQRDLIETGELWRLFTANLLHTNWIHWVLNVGGLWVVWLIYWDLVSTKWQWAFLWLPMLLNTIFMYFFEPSMIGYVGLSGALHGSIIAFGIADLKKNTWISIGLFIGVAAKLAWEQLYGASASLEGLIESSVAIDAHLWGAVSGLLAGGLYWLFLFKKS